MWQSSFDWEGLISLIVLFCGCTHSPIYTIYSWGGNYTFPGVVILLQHYNNPSGRRSWIETRSSKSQLKTRSKFSNSTWAWAQPSSHSYRWLWVVRPTSPATFPQGDLQVLKLSLAESHCLELQLTLEFYRKQTWTPSGDLPVNYKQTLPGPF